MSFNRLPYDICSYEQTLAETTGPGHYQLGTPPNSCKPCHPTDARIRLQSGGVALNKNTNLIDVDSELIGISRNLSQCPDKKYLPVAENSKLCGANGVNYTPSPCKVNINTNKEHISFDNCFIGSEDTRLSNPPCNLRGTGWNRWEWLCKNPQANLEEPYDFQINTRILAKNNHRALIPTPIDQFLVHPNYEDKVDHDPIEPLNNNYSVHTSPPSVHWQDLNNINKF